MLAKLQDANRSVADILANAVSDAVRVQAMDAQREIYKLIENAQRNMGLCND